MTTQTSFLSFGNTRLSHTINSLVRGQYYNNPYLFPRISQDETYLMSFPRSGNTWLRYLITSLIHNKEATSDLVRTAVPDVHRFRADRERKPATKPLVVKSHTPFVNIPAKVIYLVRDGRDVLLSYFHLRLKTGHLKPDMSPLEFYFKEDIWPCPWHVHVSGWLDGLETWPIERYRIIRYEDLVKSPAEQLLLIAEFIGLSVTHSDLERAISLNTKDHLKKSGDSRDFKGRLNTVVGGDRLKWQDVLSDEQVARYEALAGAELRRLGYPLASVK